jgi:hypothetical protein
MRWLWLLLIPLPVLAHMMSMSTGEIRIQGREAEYELRMPLYEIAHIQDPERSLFEHIRFSGGGGTARLTKRECHENPIEGSYSCLAGYEFPEPPDKLEVECTFHSITVPNHVHFLRAIKDGKTAQAVFDFSFEKTVIRFNPPTSLEKAFSEIMAGVFGAIGGAAQLLFLASLVLAARKRRELLALAGMFVAGEIAACVAAPLMSWQPAPRFVEASAALTVAYLAVEILLLPEAGKRWLIVGILGIFHGLYFHLFLQTSGFEPFYVMAGVILAEVALIALFAVVFSKIGKMAAGLRPVQVSASVLLAVGIVWFFVRLRG